MLTLGLYGLLAVVIMGALFLVAVNLLPAGEQIAPSVRDEAPWDLPLSRPLDASDVATIRLPVALRGYRFAETDVLLDRLGEELRARDAEIARLRGTAVGLAPLAGAHAAPDYEPMRFDRPEPGAVPEADSVPDGEAAPEGTAGTGSDSQRADGA
ncbi:MAG: cell division protein DivIVA [Jatrophihabitantaceae bacterium]